MHESDPAHSTPLVLRIGREELLIRRRYEVLSIVNDILIALWFMIGSVLFFWEATATEGTWLFLVGSIELAVRPMLRLSRRVHLRRLRSTWRHDSDSEQDF
ncbi:hypothetical protein CDG81_02990 [Actinopolyspora erythraea]|uniref:YrhK domain-containing protein n=1 Tax=Actinopolyspora erythraea TaxID=414996 RepID=A0A099D323_9ACTN|nr:YrhK family protein [Actinopolyspora erythraea]ASU77441.1 hypothetical protein CDG81_02990 [Actinopolyspora erythraea]KGI80346.1 hypothetical protein IL38_17985 [Actinopolyspora erythraea]